MTRSTAVVAGRDGKDAAEPQHVDDRLVWTNLDIMVRLEPDAQLIGVAPEVWWRDGPARLQDVFAAFRFHIAADDHSRPRRGHRGATLNLG